MFIALVTFPEVPADRETAFRSWFAWSNEELAGVHGLQSRRLLRARNGGYSALVEHESEATFSAMHAMPEVAEIQARLREIVPEPPSATQLEVVSGEVAGSCCGRGDHEQSATYDSTGHRSCHAD